MYYDALMIGLTFLKNFAIILLIVYGGRYIIYGILHIISGSAKGVRYFELGTGLIGTPVHELSHALLCLLTGARIVKIELFHIRQNSIGSVSYIPSSNKFLAAIQGFLIAAAPTLCGFVAVYLLGKYFAPEMLSADFYKNWQSIELTPRLVGYILTAGSIAGHIQLSKTDAANMVWGIPVALAVLYILSLFCGDFILKISENILSMYEVTICLMLLNLILALPWGFICRIFKATPHKERF